LILTKLRDSITYYGKNKKRNQYPTILENQFEENWLSNLNKDGY